MRRTNEVFDSEVVGKRDTSALDRVYTANARILAPGAEMIGGREPIKVFWQQAIASHGLKSGKLTTVDAESCGDAVFEIGRADLVVGTGETVAVKCVVLWKQADSPWKWHVDIWNPNARLICGSSPGARRLAGGVRLAISMAPAPTFYWTALSNASAAESMSAASAPRIFPTSMIAASASCHFFCSIASRTAGRVLTP
jgi:ketosteroid isomerase-like protein